MSYVPLLHVISELNIGGFPFSEHTLNIAPFSAAVPTHLKLVHHLAIGDRNWKNQGKYVSLNVFELFLYLI